MLGTNQLSRSFDHAYIGLPHSCESANSSTPFVSHCQHDCCGRHRRGSWSAQSLSTVLVCVCVCVCIPVSVDLIA